MIDINNQIREKHKAGMPTSKPLGLIRATGTSRKMQIWKMKILGAEGIEVTLNFASGLALVRKHGGQYRRVQFLPFLSTHKILLYHVLFFQHCGLSATAATVTSAHDCKTGLFAV